MTEQNVAAVVLAAGSGSRLKSDLPKVLHLAAGRPLLAHVLDALRPLPLAQRLVVVAARQDEIRSTLIEFGHGGGLTFASQDPPSGTGDAARVALEHLSDGIEAVLVTSGDTPLLESDTLFHLLDEHRRFGAAATMLTASVTDPAGYGRIVRSPSGEVSRIVEDRDATEDERRIHEINAGVYVFDASVLTETIEKIDRENSQGEYYLTDVISLLCDAGRVVSAVETRSDEVGGVNNRSQLAYVSGLLRHRICERWMAEGVSIIDPRTTYIDSTVVIERDATIHPFTFLEGTTRIASGAEIGPQARIIDSTVASGAQVSFAVVRESEVGPEATVGPFASLRSGTVLRRAVHLGTFVETKASVIGERSKAPHLSYLGDATIGEGVNVGAGTITCNYDGQAKHATVIDDDAYIGSDTMLVAPVRIGRRAATGAGAVVKGDVPDDALAVGVPARNLEGRGNLMNRTKD